MTLRDIYGNLIIAHAQAWHSLQSSWSPLWFHLGSISGSWRPQIYDEILLPLWKFLVGPLAQAAVAIFEPTRDPEVGLLCRFECLDWMDSLVTLRRVETRRSKGVKCLFRAVNRNHVTFSGNIFFWRNILARESTAAWTRNWELLEPSGPGSWYIRFDKASYWAKASKRRFRMAEASLVGGSLRLGVVSASPAMPNNILPET